MGTIGLAKNRKVAEKTNPNTEKFSKYYCVPELCDVMVTDMVCVFIQGSVQVAELIQIPSLTSKGNEEMKKAIQSHFVPNISQMYFCQSNISSWKIITMYNSKIFR